MTYSEKLRHPLWQKKRLQILQRDDWACRSCGTKTKNLQVHHIVYCGKGTNPWDYADDLLQSLCEDCHEIRQELTDKAANALRVAISNYGTERLMRTAKSLMETAMCKDSYRHHIVSCLHESANLSAEGRGAIPDGIWSDLLASVLECQRDPTTAFSNWGVVKQMEMALAHLKNGKNGEGK